MIGKNAIGLRLHRIDRGGNLKSCEHVIFTAGRSAVVTVLNRAAVSGRVEVDGKIEDHFADVLIDHHGTWEQTVALDAASYRALKTRWMPCRVSA